MTMEQAVMPMDTTKYNHKPLILSLNISASILLDKMTYSSEVHDKGDPFCKLLE